MRKAFACCFLLTFLLTACAPHPNLVRLSTVPEIKDYVREQYGGAELLNYELTSNSHTYHFKDHLYGFEYYIECNLEPIGLDNTVMGYHESKFTNYEPKYLEALWNRLESVTIPTGAHIALNPAVLTGHSSVLGYVIVRSKLDTDLGMQTANAIGLHLDSLDTRNILPSYTILVRDINEESIGYFDFEGCKPISDENAMRSAYHRCAQEILRHEDVMMLHSERVLFDDVPGLSQETLAETVDIDNKIVLLYHFTHQNQRYFLADIKVMYGDRPHYYIYNLTEEHSMTSILHPYIPNLDR